MQFPDFPSMGIGTRPLFPAPRCRPCRLETIKNYCVPYPHGVFLYMYPIQYYLSTVLDPEDERVTFMTVRMAFSATRGRALLL